DLDTIGQARCDRRDARLHGVDHLERVLAVTHHDDAGHDVAATILVRDTAPDVGSDLYPADVAHPHGRPAGTGSEHDVLDVLDTREVAEPAHHVLAAAELQDARTDVGVRHAHGVRDLPHGEAIAVQSLWIHLHLVLPHVPADGCDLLYAGHALQLVADEEVLQAAQRGQVVAIGFDRVLIDPADAGRVRTQLRCRACRQLIGQLREVLEHTRTRPV